MSQTLHIQNYAEPNIIGETELSSTLLASSATLELINASDFSGGDFIVIGMLSSELSELKTVSSKDGNTITLSSGVAFSYQTYTKVTRLYGNKIRIYRASNSNGTPPSDDSFSLLDTIDIVVDRADSAYTDANGSSDYWYKAVYYNASLNVETDIADSSAVRGGGVGDYASLYAIRREAGLLSNRYITDEQIDEKRQAAQREIDNKLSGIYNIPFSEPINPTIEYITVLLAAGMLLAADYGAMTAFNTNNGDSKIKEARGLLEKLNTKQMVLTDASGADISIPGTAGSYSGWPNATTATAAAENGGSERMFRMADRY